MNNTAVQIPPEMESVVRERAAVWVQSEKSRQRINELNTLASNAPAASTIGDSITTLTSGATPPEEIDQAVIQLNQQLGYYNRAQTEIQAIEAEIAGIKGRQRSFYIAIAFIGVLLLLILFFVIF